MPLLRGPMSWFDFMDRFRSLIAVRRGILPKDVNWDHESLNDIISVLDGEILVAE